MTDYSKYAPELPNMEESDNSGAKSAKDILDNIDSYVPSPIETKPVDMDEVNKQARQDEFMDQPFFSRMGEAAAGNIKEGFETAGSVVEASAKASAGMANAFASGWAAVSQYLETEIKQDFGVIPRPENDYGLIRPSAFLDASKKMEATQQYLSDKMNWKSKFGDTDDILHGIAYAGDAYEKAFKFMVGDPINEVGNYIGMSSSDAATVAVGFQLAMENATPLIILRAGKKAANLTKFKVEKKEDTLARESISHDLALIDDIATEINDVLTIQDKISGYKAGIPQIARDKSIGDVEHASMTVAGKSREFAKQQMARRQSIKDFQASLFGSMDRKGEILNERIIKVAEKSEGSLKAIIGEIDNQLRGLKAQQLDLSRKYTRNNEEKFGIELRNNMHLQYRADRFKNKTLYNSVGNPAVDASPLLSHWGGLMKDPQMKALFQDPKLEATIMQSPAYWILKDQIAKLNNTKSSEKGIAVSGAKNISMDFDTLVLLNKQLNKDLRRLNKGDNGTALYFTSKTKDVVQKTLDDLASSGVDSAKKIAIANKHYKDVIINKYERGVMGDLIEADVVSNGWAFKTMGADILNKIIPVKGGVASIERLDSFLDLYGDNAMAMQSFKGALYNRFIKESTESRSKAKAVAQDGEALLRLDENNISAFTTKYQNVLDRVPDVRDRFISKERLVNDIAKTKYALEQRKSQIQQSSLFKMIGLKAEKTDSGFRLEHEGKYTTDAYSVISDATKSESAMADIYSRVSRNTEARDGLSKAIGSVLLKESQIKGSNQIDGQKLLDILNNPKRIKAISQGMDKGHISDLRIIADAWEREKYSSSYKAKYDPEAGTYSGTKKSIGLTEGQMLNDLRQASVGRIPKQLLLTNFVVKVMRTQGHKYYEKSMSEIFMNKDIARSYANLIKIEQAAQEITPAMKLSQKISMKREKALNEYVSTLMTFGLISLEDKDKKE